MVDIKSTNFKWQRVVIKVGSALIAPDRKGVSSRYLLGIAQFIVRCREMGVQVVLVSSGSVAAGSHLFPNIDKPSVTVKKAMAAAGQTEMIGIWNNLFDFPTAQILMTHGDLRDRERYVSVKNTIVNLLDNGILPIINENDTVTTDKLRVGDNDNLSAMVAAASDADVLIICSDINGLYDKNPRTNSDAVLVPVINEINKHTYAMAGSEAGLLGTGGMRTKVEAAEKATSHGIDTFIINGFSETAFNQLLAGQNPGTHFLSVPKPMKELVHWMTYTSDAQGEVVVENDFEFGSDIQSELLTSEAIAEVRGQFTVGDTVLITKKDGTKLAKAASNYSSCLLSFIADQEDDSFATDFQSNTGSIISSKNMAMLVNKTV
ncbi:MAG: glutamate 5-kinase [Paraglaciecola sp.]|uniref:glutamate 5-kinase n=1 Tax=Pseudomonadati TaxID=3379134 RepID=UPI00273E79F3|nr:glutamate 5-kinase [Paraglaciecola sp.]MDP5030100.1 glutamate 5-kinase [Paraglaciecola sp.]MDP5041554.1 glutamate 5-kinase [Paraglaciecola sp.]MDP5130487.1 glutamate 5-kinase [Paraglaciecola sp.]